MTQFGRPKREQSLLDLATDEPKCKKPRRGGSAMDGQWLRAARDWDGGPAMDYGSRCRLVDHVPVMSQARSSWLRLLVVPVTPARTVAKKERGWRGEKNYICFLQFQLSIHMSSSNWILEKQKCTPHQQFSKGPPFSSSWAYATSHAFSITTTYVASSKFFDSSRSPDVMHPIYQHRSFWSKQISIYVDLDVNLGSVAVISHSVCLFSFGFRGCIIVL